MEIFLQWCSPPICSEYCISVAYDIFGIAIIIYSSRCLLIHDGTVKCTRWIPQPITGIQLATEIQADRTAHWYSYSVATFIIRTAVVRIGNQYGSVIILWRTYWISDWNDLLCGRYRIGFRDDTIKCAIWILWPSAILLLFTVVKIYLAVVRKCNPTCTLVKFAAVFWFRK